MATISQRSFSGGEISPSLYARTDFAKYQTSVKKLKNFIPLKYGGVSNRAGFKYLNVAGVYDQSVRLIPFDVGSGVSYVLEFGHEYMRVYTNGAQVTYGNSTITGFNWTGSVVTHTGTLNGPADEVYLSNFAGDLGLILNGRNFKINELTATTFELLNLDGSAFTSVDQPAYTSGGRFNEVYEMATGYTSDAIFNIQYSQDVQTIVLVHPDYVPSTITRVSDTDWTSFSLPTPLTNVPIFPKAHSHTVNGTTGSTSYYYCVTCEYAGYEGDVSQFPSYTSGNGPGLNQSTFVVTNGNATLSTVNSITLVSRTAAVTALSYNLIFNFYRSTSFSGDYEYIGSSIGSHGGSYYEATLTDVGLTADSALLPPTAAFGYYPEVNTSRRVDTGSSDYYPSTVAYAQQRLFFGGSNTYPENIWASALGAPGIFYKTTPITDSSAFFFKPYSSKYNKIKHIVPASKLVLLTENAELVINADGSLVTPTNINVASQSYNGASRLKPIIVNDSVLYVQSKGTTVRDLAFNFNIDGFTGNEISIFANHLFDGYELVDWCYQQSPNSIVWAVRSDGTLLSMTYLKEQQVLAWAQHETSGFVKSVACIPGLVEDELYVVIERDGVRQIELLSTRFVNERKQKYVTEYGVEKYKYYNDSASNSFVDNFLTYDGRNTVFSFTMTPSSYLGGGFTVNDTITLTASASYFVAADVGNQIFMYDSENNLARIEITAYVSATVVRGTPLVDIPAEMQGNGTSHWSKAVDQITGLWHLEGQEVAVIGDAFVDANPLNDSYDVITVEDGQISLSTPRSVVHVGLPYVCDLKSLNIDTAQGETLIDKSSLVGSVDMFVEKTRGLWAGSDEPSSGYKENLTELKLRSTEPYTTPISLKTEPVSTVIQSEYKNGGVFVRQLDPLPATILSLHPSGFIPFR